MKVLLAEDDFDFGSLLKQYLEIHDFVVEWVKDGEEAMIKLESFSPDIGVFDVMMPKMDGFTLAEKVVDRFPEVPFLFLTARKLKEDRIKGLKLGANDYIEKPFEADVLVLKLQNIIGKAKGSPVSVPKDTSHVKIGSYSYDPERMQLSASETNHQLTEKEAQVLMYLHEHRNQLIKRDDILKSIWQNEDYFSGRSMDVFISRLRKYFKDDPSVQIETIRGVGLEFKVG